jgi:hypothetical protein
MIKVIDGLDTQVQFININLGWVWCVLPVIPTTQEAEERGFGNSRKVYAKLVRPYLKNKMKKKNKKAVSCRG